MQWTFSKERLSFMPITSEGASSKRQTSGIRTTIRNASLATLAAGTLVASSFVSISAASADATSIPDVPAANASAPKVDLTLALKPTDSAALQSLAAEAKHLTPTQRSTAVDALAPADSTVDGTIQKLKDAGVSVTGHDDWSVNVSVTKEQADQLFNVDLKGSGDKLSTDEVPELPTALKSSVSGVLGLDDTPLFTPSVQGFTGPDFTSAGAVTAPKSTGAGQTVATVQFSGWDSNDLVQYAAKTNTPMPSVTQVSVDGVSTASTANTSGPMEVALDQQMILATAPQAKQRIYFAQNSGQGFYKVYSAIANDVQQYGIGAVSTSWGTCESNLDNYTNSVISDVINRVVALGATTFAASGDNGAVDCTINNPNKTMDVDYPAAVPSVIGVGGTTMTKTSTGYTHKAWSGSGGGQSSYSARPSYQANITVPGTTGRLVPDVSMVADTATPVYVYFKAMGGDILVGGTSAAAPILAGQLASTLSALGCTTGLGDIHDALYANPGDFFDVTSGSNGGYSAGVGYDAVTGLGVPQWNKVIKHLPLTGTCTLPADIPTTTPTPPVTPTPTPTPTPVAPAKTILKSGATLLSNNLQYRLAMQPDSNLVLYGNGSSTNALWSTGTNAKPDGAYLRVGTNGNAEVVSKDGKTVYWNSGSTSLGTSANTIKLTDDGNFQILNGSAVKWKTDLITNTLLKGAVLKQNQYITSEGGAYKFIFQADGNLVLYKGTSAIWSTHTNAKARGGYFAYQTDGNLVVYNSAKKAVWASGTNRKASNRLLVQTDRNVVLYNTKTVVWQTKTGISGATNIAKNTTLKTNVNYGSTNDIYNLKFLSNGELALYHGSKVIWKANTANKAPGGKAIYQKDGNFVVYNSKSKAVWSTATSRKVNTHITVQNDGNLVMYNKTKAVWSTRTNGK